jgi:hypothetical protein
MLSNIFCKAATERAYFGGPCYKRRLRQPTFEQESLEKICSVEVVKIGVEVAVFSAKKELPIFLRLRRQAHN